MRRQMSVAQYRAMDVSIFAILLMVFETVVTKAATVWFPQEPYTVSVTAAITAIVLMRWGPWAALHACLGGVVYALVAGGRPVQFLIYGAGNLLALAALALKKPLGGDEAIRGSAQKTLVFGLAVILLMQAGRALCAVLTGSALSAALGFFTTDVVSVLFTLVIVWFVRRLDGVFENQMHYLRRVQAEREREKGGYR